MLPEAVLDFLDKLLSREEINDCLNCNVPVVTGVNSYAIFEIRNSAKKGKNFAVTARVRYPAFSHFFVKSGPDLIPPEYESRYELIEDLPDGTNTFAKKLTGIPDVDGWVTASSEITIRSVPGKPTVNEKWCYDLLPNVNDANNIPGASLLLTCQPITNDGEVSDTPWRIKIRNYTNVKSGTSFKQVDVKEDYVFLSTEQFREIDEFLFSEFDQHMLFKVLLARAEALQDDYDDSVSAEATF